MIKKVLKFIVDRKSADKDLDNLKKKTTEVGQTAKDVNKDYSNMGKNASKASKKASKDINNLGKANKNARKSTISLSKGFNILGGALKAAGIGLIIALFAKLTQALSENQAVVDSVSKLFKTINIVFTQLTTSITDAFKSVSEATGGFDAFKTVISNLVKIALTPLKLVIDGVKLGILETRLAWEESFLGSGDTSTIDSLNKSILETKKSLAETTNEAVDAGVEVVKNYSEAIDEVKQLGSAVSDNISKVSIEAAKASADRIIELRKEAELAEVKLQGLTLEFQRQAEVQRQIRDDVRLSIDDRIKANDRLAEILRQQSEEELALANKRLELAEEELALNPENIQLQKQLQEALNGVADVQERITGQISEQKTNEAALEEERRANLQTIKEIGKTEQELAKQQLETELENQKQLIERTISNNNDKKEALSNAEKAFRDGLAKINAEADAKEIEQELAKQEILNESRPDQEFPDTLEGEREKALAELEIQQEKALSELDLLKATEEEKTQLLNNFTDRRNTIDENYKKEKEAREKAVRDLEVSLAASAIASIGDLLEEGSGVAKGIATAEAIFSTYAAINATLKDPTIPSTFARIAASVAIGVRGFANVKKILETTPQNAQSQVGGGAQSGAGRVSEPRFDLSRPTNVDEINTEETTQVYVTTDEVTTQQSLDRNRRNNTRFF